MSTPDYANPPVHEVVVSLAFDTLGVSDEAFTARADAALWPERLYERVELDDTRILGRASPVGGKPVWQTRVVRTGLALSDRPALEATRALQLRPELASYHIVRPSPWPTGVYVGWSVIASELRALRPALEQLYQGTRVTRLALRYLNRIAIPAGTSLDQWLAVGAYGPPGVNAAASFTVRLQWERLTAGGEFGASLGLYAIEVDEIAQQEEVVGLLLDIEAFRPNDDEAVTWSTVDACLARAHDAHGALFEACLTPALRDRFRGASVSDPLRNGDT